MIALIFSERFISLAQLKNLGLLSIQKSVKLRKSKLSKGLDYELSVETNPIPNRLKQARLRAGFTQMQLGVMIGMDEGSASGRMNHYEKGRHTPDIRTLKKIADTLGVPLNYFFCEDDITAELSIQIDRLSSDKKQMLLQFINELQKENHEL